MTRETKVGVAVAASFLSLVAVVVAARLTQKPEAWSRKGSETTVAQAPKSPAKGTPEGTKPSSQNGEKNKNVTTVAAGKAHDVIPAHNLNLQPPPVPANTQPPPVPPDLVVVPVPDAAQDAINKLARQADNAIANVAGNVNRATDKGLTTVAAAEQAALTAQKNAVGAANNAANTTQNNVNATVNQLQAEINKEKRDLQAVNPGAGLSGGAQVEIVVGPPKAPVVIVPEAPAPMPAAVSGPPAIVLPPPPPAATTNLVQQSPNAAPIPMPPPSPNATAKVAERAPVAPVPMNPPSPPSATANNVPPPSPVPITVPPAVTPQRPVAVVQAGGPSSSPPPAPVPPIGAQPQATSPAIPVKSQSAADVRSFDVESYKVQPGDQSFADISRKIYNSDQYSRALIQFNRDHPLAADGMKQDPPQLRVGTPVYFPGVDVLKSKYPDAFSGPAVPASTSVAPVQFSAPMPVTSSIGNPNLVTGPPPGTKAAFGGPGLGNTYRVRDGGERLFDIARSVLGDGNRWTQIYRLNPDVQPSYPIPAGTVLKLPPPGN